MPDKKTRRSNRSVVACTEGKGKTKLKFPDGLQRNLTDLSSGAPWRDLPPHYGNWSSIYHKFRQCCAQNLFEKILKAVVADTDKYLLVQIDSNQHAADALKKNMAIKQQDCYWPADIFTIQNVPLNFEQGKSWGKNLKPFALNGFVILFRGKKLRCVSPTKSIPS